MTVVVSMLRGVNLPHHNRIKMAALRDLYKSLKLFNPQTSVQSGNVIFGTQERDLSALTKRLENGIERRFGFRPDVILRTASEMRSVVARNPFARRRDIEPNKVLVDFLASDPSREPRKTFLPFKPIPE